ncbi:hypothetical protein CH063_02745 [Colletotrichum higginsianum]|uniref:Uncharacterized protein n=1 Tax=Colletotrichum higginsianum (strain IMI 349063) TaxID=759273 RepID=H1VP97_COLHI|nr:hypothetical protein CH063_02745 [Colletotrichum higginsianum]
MKIAGKYAALLCQTALHCLPISPTLQRPFDGIDTGSFPGSSRPSPRGELGVARRFCSPITMT